MRLNVGDRYKFYAAGVVTRRCVCVCNETPGCAVAVRMRFTMFPVNNRVRQYRGRGIKWFDWPLLETLADLSRTWRFNKAKQNSSKATASNQRSYTGNTGTGTAKGHMLKVRAWPSGAILVRISFPGMFLSADPSLSFRSLCSHRRAESVQAECRRVCAEERSGHG